MRRLLLAVQSKLELFQCINRSGVQELTACIWEIAARPTSVYKYLLEHLGSRVKVLGMRRLVHAVQSELELFQRGNRSGIQELTAYIWEIAARPSSKYTSLLEYCR